MPALPLVYYPDPLLQKPSQNVVDFAAAAALALDMAETMTKHRGIGIAAPQVGQNIRLALVSRDADKSLTEDLVMINPKIFSASRDIEEGEEGCLSIPGKFGLVPRHKKIKIRYLASSGQEKKLKAAGFLARVIQHEIDHLDGVLFIDRLSSPTK